MKKIILFLVASLAITLAFAASTEGASFIQKQAFQITDKSSGHIDVQFSMPEYTIDEMPMGSQTFHRINIPDAGYTKETGLPELPTISFSLAIPYKGTVHISLIDTQTEQIPSFMAFPSQEDDEDDNPKSFVLNDSFYGQNTSYPQALIEFGDPYILRDFRLITIQVNPFSYNPLTQELTINTNVNLHIEFSDEPGVNEKEGVFEGYSPSFKNIYEASILNFADYRDQELPNKFPRYLLIYGNSTDANFHASLNEFVFWKRQKGADVDVASTAANEAGSSTATIKTYIQNRYNNPATRPDFVILLGDTSGSYIIPTYTSPSGAGDYPYTHIDGNDLYGDVFIGRISVENLSQAQTLFAKIYLYERDINLATASWLNRMLLVGDWNHSGISTVYISRFIREAALKINPDYTFTELYSNAPPPASMNTAINQGVGFFSYRGYISMSGWSPSESLSNAYRLCHAIIPTCGTGNFNTLATTESFIRLGSAAQPKGAVTATGMATSSTKTCYNNALHGGMWGGMLNYGMRTMGESLLSSKVYTLMLYGPSNSYATSHMHWFNLMGDPTMEVYFGIPKTFNVLTQTTIPLGLSLLDVNVMNENLDIEPGASVTLSQGTSIISKGFTDAEGNLVLILPSSMGAGDCILTVSKHNFKPIQITINVDTSGTLVPATMVIDDDNDGPSQGNANDLADGGETLELLFGLKNTSDYTIAGVSGYITSTSPYVTFADSLVTYDPIYSDQVGFNSSPIVMHIGANIPHESMLRLHLILTDSGGDSYDISEFIPVSNAKIMYHSYLLENAGANNALNPGESAGLIVTLSNIGSLGLSDVYARLYTENDLVSVTEHTVYYGDMLQNVQVLPQGGNFVLYARPQVLPGMLIPMKIRLYNDAGFEQYVYFTFTVGHVTVNDPLGPDAYGYVIYDDTDTSYSECPIYAWVGIAPAEGGVGTALTISDPRGSDEGDQVNSTSIATVNLPFPFIFYGIEYNQISVCSNGFIAMGVSENAEFRNYRLPGAMGPSPMIAPFWDDLCTHSGSGIYTWFDRNNHAFVIEWYNLRSGSNGTSPQTFQVILYDPAIHAGSLGDGPIKIQYHTFNNVDATSAAQSHGCHSTIGIKDHTGTIGLEYTFKNQYPTAAAPLGNGKALFITNIPIYYEASHLVVGDTYISDPNGNGICEPGEEIELGIQVSNIGNAVAVDPVGTISTDSQYVNMLVNESLYYPINGDNSGVNRTPFRFVIDPNCPDGTVINFSLELVSEEDVWSRQFSLQVSASQLAYMGFMIDDSNFNHDGVINPGENIQLVVKVRNSSDVAATQIMATLSSMDSEVIIGEPIIFMESIQPDNTQQFVFNLEYLGDGSIQEYKSFQFNASSFNGQPISANLTVPFNMNNIFSDFETENGGFVSEVGWAWGTPQQVIPFSGAKVWATNLSGTYPDLAILNLYTPQYRLEANAMLSFMHRYGMENNYDGGNVSISTNGGNTWTVITPIGGYTHGSLAGLSYAPGFSGTLNQWQQVQFNLNNYANQSVMFRFRMGSDSSTNGIGWFIDNYEITNVSQKVGFLNGVVTPVSNASPANAIVRADNGYATNPLEDGSFRLYLPNGVYSITASLPYHQSSTVYNVDINPDNPIHDTEYTLISLPKPASITKLVDNDTGLVALDWNEPEDALLPIMEYRVYKRFNCGPFELLQETTGLSYVDIISLEGDYQYYVTALYLNTEGEPSDVVSFTFPYVSTPEDMVPATVTKLHRNYPNPFNPSTTIAFDLAKSGPVKLTIYNVKGQLVRRLVNNNLTSGNHKIVWNGKDERNRSVASGVYYFRLETKDYVKTNKMLLMK